MTSGPELFRVEQPFLDQLAGMGWKTVTGSVDHPSVTGRETFREVLLKPDLDAALRRINLRDGEPWLDDARVTQTIGALDRIAHPRLIEANQQATDLLLHGIPVEGLPGWEQGRAQTVLFIDWDHPENNRFTAISQFKVDCPGGQSKGSIRPDIVLFINGIPVVVVECKSPGIAHPIPDAVDQLRLYQNVRRAAGGADENEGNARLFFTNQLLVATCFDEARVATIGAETAHFMEWKDTAPVSLDQVRAEVGRDQLSSQHRLVAGLLRPEHLLDVIRHFVLFKPDLGRIVKVVGRYQQFRAVHAAVGRLLKGKTRLQDGEHDRRGGIVWHTQGSGKSLTMVFLVRKLRSMPELRRFKVVLVTDRKDIERQLSGTADLTGETVRVGRSIAEVKRILRQPGPGLVFAMIQKYVDRDLDALGPQDDVGDLGVLNEDEAIVVLVDEAHRSHTSALHARLLQALPNCARIGFTGTPIIMGAKRRTHEIFGEFLDRYTLAQSEADGATVPILYEGRTSEAAVAEGRDLDDLFEDLFHDRTPEELQAIQAKYATRGAILEAEQPIAAKARDMLRHYVANLLPNGLKAQVVAVSRRAAVRYQKALVSARDELVGEAEALDPATRVLDDVDLALRPAKLQAAVRAARSLDLLRRLEFAAVISALNTDPGEWAEWSDPVKVKNRTGECGQFKRPLLHPDPAKTHPLALLCVQSMLLTGFDAPIEGAIYLDRPIREAELLQAIARVNRTGFGKKAGLVVDYVGVAQHLTEALAAYAAEDIEGALQSLADEIPKLRDRHARLVALFRDRGVDPIREIEAAKFLLADERLRAEFVVKLKQFLATLDLVLPRPAALPYVRDAQKLGQLHDEVRRLYRDGGPELGKEIGQKVQHLIDTHLLSLGIEPRIPPIAITDAHFAEHVSRQVSARAKASEMEHAIRHQIRKKLDEDPVLYRKLSERLEEILKKLGEDWEQLALALQGLVQEVTAGRRPDAELGGLGLDPEIHAPFFDLLREARGQQGTARLADPTWLAGLTVELVDRIVRDAVKNVGFWQSAPRQEELRGRLFMFLDENEIVDFDRADAVADQLLELAKANHHRLTRS